MKLPITTKHHKFDEIHAFYLIFMQIIDEIHDLCPILKVLAPERIRIKTNGKTLNT